MWLNGYSGRFIFRERHIIPHHGKRIVHSGEGIGIRGKEVKEIVNISEDPRREALVYKGEDEGGMMGRERAGLVEGPSLLQCRIWNAGDD